MENSSSAYSFREGACPATEELPERSARFSSLGYPSWKTIGAEGDVCGPQPHQPNTSRTIRTGWDHEAMRD